MMVAIGDYRPIKAEDVSRLPSNFDRQDYVAEKPLIGVPLPSKLDRCAVVAENV